MKKTNKLWLAAVTACGILTAMNGCVTYHKTAGVNYLVRPETANAVKYVTKYKVSDKRVTGKGEAQVVLGFLQFSDGKYCQMNSDPNLSVFSMIWDFFSPTQKAVDNAKNSALYNACEKHGADQLLGGTFEYTISNYFIFASVECIAKGFAAEVEKIELVEKQPVVLNNWQKIEYVPAHYDLPNNAAGANISINPAGK